MIGFIDLANYIGNFSLQNAKAPVMLTSTEVAAIKEIINIVSLIGNITKEMTEQEKLYNSGNLLCE